MTKSKQPESIQKTIVSVMVNRQAIFTFVVALVIVGSSFWGGQVQIGYQHQSTMFLAQWVNEYIDSAIHVLDSLTLISPGVTDLKAVEKAYSSIDALYLINRNGRLMATSPANPLMTIGIDMSKQPYFDAELKTLFISRPYVSPYTENLTINLSLPIKGKEEILVGEINLIDLQESVRRSNISQIGDFLITDQDGLLLAHPNQELVRQMTNIRQLGIIERAKEGQTRQIYTVDGRWMLGIVIPIERTNWYAITQAPVMAVYGTFLIPSIIGLFVALFFFLVFAWRERLDIAERIVAPLRELSQDARRLANGDFSAEFSPQIATYQEAISLIDSFERMKEAVQSREESLHESENRYRQLFDMESDAIFLIDTTSEQIIEANNAATTLYGYSREELLLKKATDLSAEPEKTLQTIKNENTLVPIRWHKKKDGTVIQVEITGSYFERSGQKVLIAAIRDITERKRAEETLVISEKMAGIGTLASGIAHEINSPLQVITGISESLERRIKKNQMSQDELQKQIIILNRNAWRIAEIVKSLLLYSRSSSDVMENHNLNQIIHDTLLLIEHQLKTWSNISVQTKLASHLPDMICDRNKITQVIINLTNNAKDAMADGGKITLSTQFNSKQQTVIFKVKDTGIGIPQEIRARIFDPFYTTKPIGKGTGLGLSIVMGIVQAHGGIINIDSSPQMGTCFTLTFPVNPPLDQTQGIAEEDV